MTATEHADALFRRSDATVADRVADLIDRMTLAEKLAQLGSAWIFQIADRRGLDVDRCGELLGDGIGHITRLSGASNLRTREGADLANQIQRHLLDHTRLGIPTIIHEEICSGLMAREATVYPQALGVASTFRPEHNRALADTVRAQMRATGSHHGLSPVLDLCRDARWGRLEETYGEDPHLVSRMGVDFVRGLQGDDLTVGVIATAKHLVGYGASEGGMNWAPAHLGERELRDAYLRPFEHAVRDAGMASIMNGYHELDGVPCAASRWLFTDLLRDEWGFDGTVVADYFSIRQLDTYHHVVADPGAAAATALHAGIDVELPGTDCFGAPLLAAIDRGIVAMADIDLAVGRVLDSKFRLGLFEQPTVDLDRVEVHTRTAAQRQLARRIAADSLVLLSNDGLLPLAAPTSIAVIGPNAASARSMLGDYSYVAHVESLIEVLRSGQNVFSMPIRDDTELDDQTDLSHVGTVLGELPARFADAVISHARGCDVMSDDRSGFDDAVAAAAQADVAILVMGDKAGLTADCTSGESRDAASLDLPGVQEELVLAVAATGTPVVLVLVAGRPIGSPAVHAAAGAVLMAWLPGEQGAAAIGDVLSGARSPGGKLPVSYPRSSGQLPMYYSHKVSGGRSHWKGAYIDLSNEPLHPFGHGLSYSSFAVDVETLDGAHVRPGDVIDLVATVSNTGACTADEVVQVYSHDPIASITRPVLELQAFHRVTLTAGESARLRFEVPVDALGFSGPDLAYVVEPGVVEFHVGTSSDDVQPAGHVVIDGEGLVGTRRPLTERVTVELL